MYWIAGIFLAALLAALVALGGLTLTTLGLSKMVFFAFLVALLFFALPEEVRQSPSP